MGKTTTRYIMNIKPDDNDNVYMLVFTTKSIREVLDHLEERSRFGYLYPATDEQVEEIAAGVLRNLDYLFDEEVDDEHGYVVPFSECNPGYDEYDD